MIPSGLTTPQGNVRGNQRSHVKLEEESNLKLVFHPNGSRKQLSPRKFSSQTGYTSETASTVQELPGVSNSSSALSLLSKNLSSHSTEIPPVMDQSSPNAFCSSVMDSMEIGQARSPVFLGSSSTPVDFQVQATRNLRRSDYVKAKGYISPEHGQTVDLVQLSSHLQRVEQQRNSMQLKQANENFCYFPTI